MSSKNDKFYLKLALNLAKQRKGLTGENPSVGCVIVKNNKILSLSNTSINGRPHAEANAIAKVAQSNESSTGASIFCTHMPCIECAKLIHQAGITEVYYRIPYEAAKGSGREFLEKSNISLHHVEATNGQD